MHNQEKTESTGVG